ncbi:MAG: ferrous iron transport protein A [Clostridia bacterium]|nr:ferrous iron transport protein A [Clostridia bacterium]
MAPSLNKIPIGQVCRIKEVTASGILRRRLLDLGFVPGGSVFIVRRAPLGDPTAYLVRGALIALREEEAATIDCRVKEEEDAFC